MAMLLAIQTGLGAAAVSPPPPPMFEYVWSSGSLNAAPDVAPAAQHTLLSAEELCTALPLCAGFTYVGDNSSSKERLTMFKAQGRANSSETGWSSWTKMGVITPPALNFSVGSSNLSLALRASAFTIQSLGPNTDPWGQNFSFVRTLSGSALPAQAHVGDLTIRLQRDATEVQPPAGCHSSGWETYSSALGIGPAAKPIAPQTESKILAAHDISALLARSAPNGSAPFPLTVVRSYEVSADEAALVMRFNISLPADATASTHIGGLGFAMPEGNGHPPSGIETSVWNEAHIGGAHGFVEYVRVVDDEATLLVTPERGHHNTSRLEAWRPMLEDAGPGGWNNEWTVHSAAWAEEWACNRQSPFMEMDDAYQPFYPEETRVTPWPCADGTQSMPRLSSAQQPWLEPTSKILQPGETLTVAFRLQRAPSGANPINTNITGPGPRTRDALLENIGEPVLHAIPGYVLSSEMRSAKLLVLPPTGSKVSHVTTESVGAGRGEIRAGTPMILPDSEGFWIIPLSVAGEGTRGRVRVNVHFSDGTDSTAHYYVLPKFSDQVERLGHHMAHVAWLPRDYPDPFGRGASCMPWDRSANGGEGAHVLDDARAYDVGLSDDAGGGNPLCLASKTHAAPRQDQVTRVDEFIEFTLYGIKNDTAKWPFKSLQVGGDPATGCHNETAPSHVDCDGIRMTMYYYARECDLHTYCPKYNCTLPPRNTSGYWPWNYTEVDKCSGLSPVHPWCMDERMANATYRAFNYPHHTATYWAMYHVARHYDLLETRMPWQWYLERAAKTSLRFSCGTGVMDGTVFREVLKALKAEGTLNSTFAAWAEQLDSHMRGRQQHWARQRFPYGSEFAFDTTGQEEVVVWNLHYNNTVAAKATVDHILSYMRSIPSWAYNGGARAADSGNNGKWMPSMGTGKPDRGQMHYRSGLNMIPLLEYYRQYPNDNEWFLLEIAMGAIAGQLTNIDENGATSMFFHAYPWVMEFDPHSGDYGLGFFGNALESGAYYIQHARLGTLCYLCTATTNATTGISTITPEDAYHRRVFIQPLGLYLVASAGTIGRIEMRAAASGQPSKDGISVFFNATEFGERPWTRLRLTVERPSEVARQGNANSTCVITQDGERVSPVSTDASTFTFLPAAKSQETKVLLAC